MPIRPPWGTRLGSGRPTAAIEHAGSPTVPAAAIRCAAAIAAAEVNHVVVGPDPVAVGAGVGVPVGAGVCGRVDGRGAVVAVGREGVTGGVLAGGRTGFGVTRVDRWVGGWAGADTVGAVGAGRCAGGVVGAWDVRGGLLGAVRVGRGAGVVGVADGVLLDVSGAGLRDGRGVDVGTEMSLEGDGLGRGVPPSVVASHTPTPPPSTSTAAPAAIHGALRGGRR